MPDTPSTPTDSGWKDEGIVNPDSGDGSSSSTKSKSTKSKTTNTKKCVLKLVYHENGAEGDPPSTTSQTYNGEKKEVTFTDTVKNNETFMTKTGYWFKGWATSASGDVVYKPGDVITKTWTKSQEGTTTVNLYAVWTNTNVLIYQPDQYTNEPYYVCSTMGYNDYDSSDDRYFSYEAPISDPLFTRKGYTQVGWALTENGPNIVDFKPWYFTYTQQNLGTTIDSQSSEPEVTYYPVDYPIATGQAYLLPISDLDSFGVRESKAMLNTTDDGRFYCSTSASGENYRDYYNPFGHAGTSYGDFRPSDDKNSVTEFIFGLRQSDGKPVSLYKVSQITMVFLTDYIRWVPKAVYEEVETENTGKENIADYKVINTFYPTWEPNEYTITLHANGGVGEDVVLTVTYDTEITIPSNLFTKTGYHLQSWNESPDGTGITWLPITYTFTRDKNIDLYAVWEGNAHTVYYSDGIPGSNSYIHSSTAVYGSPFYTDRVPIPEERIYNSLEGWTADDGTVLTRQDVWYGAYSYGADPTWTLDRDVVITPIWAAVFSLGKIFFGGKYSDEYGIYVEEPPSYTWPQRDYKHNKAYGRNGDILSDPKRFENVSRVYKISAYDGTDYYNVAKKVSEWLHRGMTTDYIRLEDSYEPDVYRLAVYEESNTLDNILATAGKCEITFSCKPQKYLLSGEKQIPISQSNQIIHNPTEQSSYPIIKFKGTGSIFVNGAEIAVYANRNEVTIDCETVNTVDVTGNNMNYYTYIEKLITLRPGDNVITFSDSVYDVKVIPRWWTI